VILIYRPGVSVLIYRLCKLLTSVLPHDASRDALLVRLVHASRSESMYLHCYLVAVPRHRKFSGRDNNLHAQSHYVYLTKSI
jgi:hypothetical protein